VCVTGPTPFALLGVKVLLGDTGSAPAKPNSRASPSLPCYSDAAFPPGMMVGKTLHSSLPQGLLIQYAAREPDH
jgi:hypothetical protein